MEDLTRAQLAQRIDQAQAEIIEETARTSDLRLALIAAIESQVASLNRERWRVWDKQRSACSGECSMKQVLEAERDLDENLDRIARLTLDIEDFKSELEETP